MPFCRMTYLAKISISKEADIFHNIPAPVRARMKFLEEVDSKDRADGTPRMQRLRQIPPETGKFLALLLANTPQDHIIEVGTSAGYSTLWLALAAAATGRRVTTFEILPEKVNLARQTFQLASVEHTIELVADDARKHIERFDEIAFCFLDAEKEVYSKIYEMVIPRLTKGGLLVADNAINHRETLQLMLERVINDERVDKLIVPIGMGELVCRKL